MTQLFAGGVVRTFRLTNEPEGLGLSCTPSGISLAGVPLLRKTRAGFVPRPVSEIVSLLEAAYGVHSTTLQSRLDVIAQAAYHVRDNSSCNSRMDLANPMAVSQSSYNLCQRQWCFDRNHEDQGMKPIQRPFKKTARIFKSNKYICVEALSGANIIKYLEDDECSRFYLEPNASDEALGQALLAALAKSRSVEEREFFDRDRAMRAEANWEKDAMRRYGFKTKRDVYKGLDWCSAKIFDGNISIEPHRRYRSNYWKPLPADRTVILPETQDAAAAGAALRLALDRCE